MTLEPGDLGVVPFPFSDRSSQKLRPALVVAGPVNGGQDVILCGMTSNLHNADHSILVEPDDMASGRLLAVSRVKATQVCTTDIAIIRKRVGVVGSAVLEAVRKEFRAMLKA